MAPNAFSIDWNLGCLTADLGRQRRAHAVIVRGAALHVLDPAQHGFPAARGRHLVSKPIRHFGDAPREFVLDELGLGGRDRGANPRAGRRILKQDLAHLGLVVAQENDEIVMAARKGIRPCAATANFGCPRRPAA